MSANKLVFVAKIEDIGAISEDGKRRQTIQLKDVATMNGDLFTEQDGFVKITIEKMPEAPGSGAESVT
jgi:hypothetical protein